MNEIENKLLELYNMLTPIPQECKGEGNTENRKRYMEIRYAISKLINDGLFNKLKNKS